MPQSDLDLPDLDLRLRVAEAVVREAGQAAAGYFRHRADLTVGQKGLQDMVSEADRACEELLVAGLVGAFPEDGVLGEEGGARNAGARAVWVIDPIDGTHNFLTGLPFWCLSVGLVVGGEAVLGIIYHPPADELFSARAGGGASLNGARITVSGATELRRARLCLGFSYRRPPSEHVEAVAALLDAGCEYCRLGSGALGLAYSAAGRFDGYWERHMNSWDAVAGLVLVREAGGWTNAFLAEDGLNRGNEVLAATPALVADFKRLTRFADS